MKFIGRHITMQILAAALAASVILCLAIVLQQTVRFVDLIVNRGLPASDFAYLAFLISARIFAALLPIAVFGAALFTYSRMQSGSELVVLRAAGVSSFRLAAPGLWAGALAVLIGYLFSLYLMPLSAQALRSYLTQARSEIGSLLIKPGQFNDIRSDLTVFVRATDSNGDFLGLVIHSEQKNGERVTVVAERGGVVDTDTGARLLLRNGNQQTETDGEVHAVWFDEYTFDLKNDDSANRSYREDNERFLPDLLYPDNSTYDVKNRTRLIAQGHNRLAQPILGLSYVSLALLFLLKTETSRLGHTRPIILAVLSMTGLLAANMALVSAASKNGVFIPVLYAAAILPFLVGVGLLLRPGRRRRRATPLAEAAA
ncbi:MAG: LptF/LptG family permease [Alphaproteobacteria bacterium]|nr:LptF/LptG family permease [Alphaproteobacteria bacterium]